MTKPIAKEINALDPGRLKSLQGLCQQYVDEEFNEDSDLLEYIAEEAVMLFFGKDVFDYINNKQE